MPNNLQPASPSGVLPASLSAAFTEELRFEAFINSYLDGTSDRLALALNPRRFFRMTRKLTLAQYTLLWAFYQAHLITPFFFYHGPETTPPFTSDPTGSSTIGRYAVVFDGGWSESIAISRSQVSLGLREVA